MKNKLVKIITIYNEVILCIITNEDLFKYYYKNELGKNNYIDKDIIKEISILGEEIWVKEEITL